MTTNYKTIRGLVRGLEVLKALNIFNGGATINEISAITHLHRTTVRRILETLIAEKYVRKADSDDSYWIERHVRDLSEGYRDEHWISSIAAPLLTELLNQVRWPTDLTTLDVDSMIIRESTHRFSPLSFHRSMVGRRLPLLCTASGRAYFAFCQDTERQELLKILRNSNSIDGTLARKRGYVENLVRQVRRQQYGSNYKEWEPESRIGALALPVRKEEKVFGCLSLVYIAEAMSLETAVEKYFPIMQKTVKKIEIQLQ